MNKIYVLVIFMMIVTYLPRLIPFLFIKSDKIPKRLKEYLSYIPYAALGALIFPGFIDAIPGKWYVSLLALIVAYIVGVRSKNVILPVLGSIFTCMLLINLV